MLNVTVTYTSEMFSSSYTYRTNVPFYKCTVNLTFFFLQNEKKFAGDVQAN